MSDRRERSNEPFAYALYYLNFSSFRGQTGVYLEDIYIQKDFRKYGIGELMLKQIARAGKENGAVRMDFQVLDWNTPAINFYKKHGAVMDESERHFKFTDEAFERFSGSRQRQSGSKLPNSDIFSCLLPSAAAYFTFSCHKSISRGVSCL